MVQIRGENGKSEKTLQIKEIQENNNKQTNKQTNKQKPIKCKFNHAEKNKKQDEKIKKREF